MWIKREFESFLEALQPEKYQSIKVLKGPRQVGKTSVIERLGRYKLVSLDDIHLRRLAQEDPKLFLDQFNEPILLDEASLAPELFFELKRRVDLFKKQKLNNLQAPELDIWVTGSNQTLLEKNVQESLAGRASYFDLNTLSISELNSFQLRDVLLRGGWPELQADKKKDHVAYLNDLISTFIEKDIVSAAGIERKAAFTKSIGLIASRVGQLINYSDIAKNVGVDVTTLQSWISKLEQNALVRTLQPYSSNLNQRLIKTPKIYFEDIGLASRFQGWTSFEPLYVSSQFGHLIENLALIELCRYFQNKGIKPEIYFLRSKEKVEIDFFVRLPNNRWIAIEVKTTPSDFSDPQIKLLDSVQQKVIEKWILTPSKDSAYNFKNSRVIGFDQIARELKKIDEFTCKVASEFLFKGR